MKILKYTIALWIIATATFAQNLPEMVKIQGGTFLMGYENGSITNDAAPLRNITVSDFFMSKTPVTVAQWKYYIEKTGKKMPTESPSWGWVDSHPMVNITWSETVDYCDWLSEQTGKIIRLPTEAEWEYAAQEDNKSKLTESGWFQDDSLTTTKPVALKKPNKFGLYDMVGNVWVWCRDWYGWYNKNQIKNPIGPYFGDFRTLRGGSWYNFSKSCGSHIRQKCTSGARFDYIGFRVAAKDVEKVK